MKKTFLYVCLYVSLAMYFTACCPKQGEQGLAGPKGEVGNPGLIGLPGSNGHSAVFSSAGADLTLCPAGGSVLNAGVDLNDDETLQLNEVKATSVTCNGQDGVSPVPSPYQAVGLVSACGGSILDPNNELFIRLANGELIGSVSENVNGKNTHFGIVAPGTWISTGSNGHTCTFTVDSNYNLTHN